MAMRFEVLLSLSCPAFQSLNPCKVGDNAAMAAKQRNHPRSVKSKGGGNFARSTRAGGLKQVTQFTSASLAGQEVFVDQGAECESVVLLKNLAKQLVDRIEAACAARNNTSQVSNPNKARNIVPESHLLHGTDPGPEVSNPSISVKSGEDHDVRQSHECGSNIGVDNKPCAVPEEKAKFPPYLNTQKHSEHLADNRTDRNPRVRSDDDDDARQCLRGGRHDLELESLSCSRETRMVTTHSSSLCDESGTFRPNSRPSSRPLTQMVPSPKKVNVNLELAKRGGVHPTPRRNIRSPGLRPLVAPQVKGPSASPAGLPANMKLVKSSTPIEKNTQAKSDDSEPALQGVGALESEELFKTVWADVVQDVFDEVFRGPERAASRSSGVLHKTANVDIKQYVKIPSKESPSTESAQCSTRSKKDVGCKAPVILPTLAKYHMDKIERNKKGVGEKQLRERRFQKECRPSTAPDPYNVLNVYAERCASQTR